MFQHDTEHFDNQASYCTAKRICSFIESGRNKMALLRIVDTLVYRIKCKWENHRKKTEQSYFNHSKPSGFFTYHKTKHSKILHGARFVFSVLYGSQNRERPLLYTLLNYLFL
jgi:1,4-alpha-glucan branching enzyme